MQLHGRRSEMVGMLILFGLLLPACQPAAAPQEGTSPGLPLEAPQEIAAETQELATAGPTQTQPGAATETQTPAAPVEIGEVNTCLECHTDQQALIDSAKAVEVVASENSGEG